MLRRIFAAGGFGAGVGLAVEAKQGFHLAGFAAAGGGGGRIEGIVERDGTDQGFGVGEHGLLDGALDRGQGGLVGIGRRGRRRSGSYPDVVLAPAARAEIDAILLEWRNRNVLL